MHPLRQFIENYTPLTNNEWDMILKKFKPKSFKKGELILRENEVCRSLYFLEKGLMRYYINKDGDEVTKFFTEAPYAFTSQYSFTSGKSSNENIEVLEDALVWEISLSKANELLEIKAWSTFIRKLIQEVQFHTEQILEELQTQTAEDRYFKLLDNNPKLIQRISLKHLASYLGIAPQSLSRIRKKITKR